MKHLQTIIVIVTLIAGVFIPKPLNAQANAPPISVNFQRTFARVVFIPLRYHAYANPQSLSLRTIDEAPLIRATRRISIPFGFETPLPVLSEGRDVVASGHGGCTADEQVTVAITITQSASGAVATGELAQTCSGELQTWYFRVTADTPDSFTNAAAEACGLATTRDGGYVTGTFDWCKDVELVLLEPRLYLPMILKA